MIARLSGYLMCVVTAFFCVGVAVGADADVASGPPELGMVVIRGNQVIELNRFTEGMVTRTTTNALPLGVTVHAEKGFIVPTTKEIVPIVSTYTTKVDVAKISMRRVDGREISGKALVDELAKPTAVILEKPGQQLDPFFLKMFKPETMILSLPASPKGVPDFVAPTGQSR